jgi:hypothetical protein
MSEIRNTMYYRNISPTARRLVSRDIWDNVYNFVQSKNSKIIDIQVKNRIHYQVLEDLDLV